MSIVRQDVRSHVDSYIIKLTGDCNLGCPYCYHFGGTPRIPKSRLNLELIQKFMDQASKRSQHVELIWHGGEPLMAGIDTFEKILDLQRNLSLIQGTSFHNLIQTNGTLINQEWIDLFRRGHFGVGVSLDGPKWLHDKSRVYVSGKSSYEQTIRGIQLLQSNNLPFSVLAVVTKSSLEHVEEIFNFFINLGIKRFDFLPCVETDLSHNKNEDDHRVLTKESLQRGEFADFMKHIFDLWYNQDDPSINVRYLENVLVGLLGGRPSTCKFNGTCASYVCVTHNGTVMPCDNFIGHKELEFGNLEHQTLNELLDGKIRMDFQISVSTKRSECTKCLFLPACGGGCNKYSYMWNGNFRDPNYFCGDRWQIFTHIADVLKHDHFELPLITSRLLSSEHNMQSNLGAFIPLNDIKYWSHQVGKDDFSLHIPYGVVTAKTTSRNLSNSISEDNGLLKKRSSGKALIDYIFTKVKTCRQTENNWNDWDKGWDNWDRGR